MSQSFFDNYNKAVKEVKPHGGARMNIPVGVTSPYKGKIGIEIELEATNYLPTDGHFERVRSPKTQSTWASIRDGSLRGNSMEYILRHPCDVEEVPYLVKALYDTIANHGTHLDISNRCSTHVHLNMTGQRLNTLTSLIILWGIFEPFVIEWCGEERKTNHFCLSFKDSLSVPTAWSTFLKTGNRRGFARDLKYSAFNFLPLFDKGSVEFRCGRASDTPEFAQDFATFLHAFAEYVFKTYKDPSRIAHDLSERGGYLILQEICKDIPKVFEAIHGLSGKTPNAFNDEAIYNFRIVQELSLGFPWHEWLALIDKTYVPDPFSKAEKYTLAEGAAQAPVRFEDVRRGRRLVEMLQQPIGGMPEEVQWQPARVEPALDAPVPDGIRAQLDLERLRWEMDMQAAAERLARDQLAFERAREQGDEG